MKPHTTPQTPLLVLVGPTGSGKTAVAIELCRLLHGEIISADSMQIFRNCDIVTAKPSAAEQQQARHHLIDICHPTERFSAAEWAVAARIAIDEIRSRGRVPIIAGGTGFYLRALIEPEVLSSVPPNAALRAQLQAELEEQGKDAMWHRLQQLDAPAAARLHPNDTFRVLRALEIVLAPQSTLSAASEKVDEIGEDSQLQVEAAANQLTRQTQSRYDTLVFGLSMPRAQLYRRLEQRVETMISGGADDELHSLLAQGLPRDSPVLGSVGYKHMLLALDGVLPRDEAIELWQRDTRRYAKRQMTWFRHQLDVTWIEIEDSSNPATIALEIAAQFQHRFQPEP